MDLQKAWALLGQDVRDVLREARAAGTPARKLAVLERHLEEARKLAKRRLRDNHPDRNLGDAAAERRYKGVQEALVLVEGDTERFRKRVEDLSDQESSLPDGTIVFS